MLELEEHPNFYWIEYPTLDHNCCDLLIGADHVKLLLPRTRNEFRHVSGNLHATRTCAGWIITGNEHSMAGTYHLTALIFPDDDSP